MERPIRVLTVRPSLDGHWRGLAVVSAALRDAGMEVIYGGTALNAEEIVNVALQEDVDAIGLSMYGRFGIAYKVQEKLRGLQDRPLLVVGGTVPPAEVKSLKEAGIDEVFVAGSGLDSIVDFIREKCSLRKARSVSRVERDSGLQ
jgi:methylmalonyl-CoA mutase C-terminal domain/subunit